MWAGDASEAPARSSGVHLLEEILEEPIALKTLLRGEIGDGDRAIVAMTDHQIARPAAASGNPAGAGRRRRGDRQDDARR